MNEELESTLDRLFPLTKKRATLHYLNCPDTIDGHHGSTDANGRCKWCKRRLEPKTSFVPDPRILSELDAAYRYTYDPDFGTRHEERY